MDGLMLERSVSPPLTGSPRASRIENRARINFLDLLGCFVFNNAIVCEKRIQIGKV